MSYFPDPPHDIRATAYLKAIVGCIACLAFAGLMGWFGVAIVAPLARALSHEADVWEHGVPAVEVGYEGESRTNRFVFHEYKLKVQYTDDKEGLHEAPLEFWSLGAEMDDKEDAELRYDPNAPDDFALGPARKLASARWASVGLFGAMAFAFAILGPFGAWKILQNLSHIRACARDGAVASVDVVGGPTRDQYGNATYSFRPTDAPPATKPRKVVFAKARAPIFLGGETKRALAIASRSSPDVFVVVRSDGYPFTLSEDERVRVRAAAEAKPARKPEGYG